MTYLSKIQIPQDIRVTKTSQGLVFSGALGSTGLNFKKIDPSGTSGIRLDPRVQTLEIITATKSSQGLVKKLVANKIHGVSRGFLVYLKIGGIGYRASLDSNTLVLKLGYSHDIVYTLPPSVGVYLVDATTLCLFGIEKNQLTQIASKIRALRKPSAYKGKGIRILDEKLHLKLGKRK
jgi:large subunit ribosomal protein L6